MLKKEAAQARQSLHLSECHIVGNHLPRLLLRILTVEYQLLRNYHAKP